MEGQLGSNERKIEKHLGSNSIVTLKSQNPIQKKSLKNVYATFVPRAATISNVLPYILVSRGEFVCTYFLLGYSSE